MIDHTVSMMSVMLVSTEGKGKLRMRENGRAKKGVELGRRECSGDVPKKREQHGPTWPTRTAV